MLSHELPPGSAGPRDPRWLRFYRDSFSGECFSTLACSIIFDGREFGTRWRDYHGEYDRASPPLQPGWLESWDGKGGYLLLPEDHGGKTFPGPAELHWRAMDGSDHATVVDLAGILGEKFVARDVSKDEIPDAWFAGCSTASITSKILLMVDDRTVSLHVRAHVTTRKDQEPGNEENHHRTGVKQVWSRTF